MKRIFVAASLLLLTFTVCSCSGTSSSSTSSSEELPSVPDREEDSLSWYEVGCSDLDGLEYVYEVYSRNNYATFIVPSPVSPFSVINSYTFRGGV